jgi:DNA-binding response OmpR family regulator
LRFFATASQRARKSEVRIKKGREIKLTATEYALLRLFVRHPGRVLTHRYILREIWGLKSEEHRQYLRVYVTHLRQKIESDPASPSLIKTEPGIGYRFISNEAFQMRRQRVAHLTAASARQKISPVLCFA